jgi:ribonuclease J
MKFNPFNRQKRMKEDKVFTGSSGTGKDSVRIIPLGGTGNVTKNMFVYEYRYDGKIRDILIVDCGIGFPDEDMYGIDLVLPDIRYLADKKQYIRGLVFTHGHDDHIGGIAYLYPKLGRIPMWGTKLTAAFANIKLTEAKLKARVTPVEFSETLRIGPFTVSFVRMTHSVPDTANLIIETPVGIFYHGSDFKFDFDPLDGKKSELEKITAVGKRGVLALLTDSLGSERPGFTPSEQVVGQTLEKEINLCSGKFIFTTQSSNISRIQLAIEIALKHGRKIAFFGRSMDHNVEAALKLGYMRFPADSVIRDQDLQRLPPTKQFLIAAGAQGQTSSALNRMANDNHKFVHIEEGDTVVFSADPIPGNEGSVGAIIEQLYRKGARVAYSDIMEDLHVSGHGSQGDLMLLLSALGPKYIFPIGGTYRHIMQYRRLALDLGYEKRDVLIPEEGQVLEFTKGFPPRVVETIGLENVMIDGLGVGDVGNAVLRDRQTIATDGIVVVVVPMEKSTGRITAEPDIISRGFVYMKESGDLLQKAQRVVSESLRLKKGRITDWRFVRTQLGENLERFLLHETGRRPLIVPVIVEV